MNTIKAWLIAASGLSLAWGAMAQPPVPEPTPPKERPHPSPIKPTGAAPDTPRPAGPQTKEGSIPGLEEADYLVSASPLRSEGTFLVEKRGSMIKLGTGERVFVFHADEKGARERAMVLLPCQKLQQMEQMGADEPTTFVVTGQVFAYLSVNYLLPTLVRQVSGETPRPKPELGHPGQGANVDPSVGDLIKQLEAQREAPRGAEGRVAEAKAGVAKGDEVPLPEGQAIVRRRARMVRVAGGDWALAFDSGIGGDVKLDRPLTLSPCLNLQRMEAWAMRAGDATSFEVSGRVLAYQGRNYLIPTMYQVCPTTDIEAKH